MKMIQFSALVMTLGLSVNTWAAAPTYKVTDLGLGADFRPIKINDAGQIAGILYSTDADGNVYNHAALYSAGLLKDLGTLGGLNSSPSAMNSLGHVVGSAESATSYRPFVNSNGTTRDLGGNYADARGINKSGQVVGEFAKQGDEGSRAFLLSSQGNAIDIGNLGGTQGTSARGINDAGTVTGYSTDSAGQQRAFIYENGTMSNLGTLAWHSASGLPEYSIGYGINNAGQVIGVSSDQAFLYSNGKLISIVAGGSPTDINDAGQVIGSYGDTRGNIHPFLYDKGSFLDLQQQLSPLFAGKWLLTDVMSINNVGDILALAVYQNEYHAVLLTATAVPEPEVVSMAMAGLLLVGLMGMKCRQKNHQA